MNNCYSPALLLAVLLLAGFENRDRADTLPNSVPPPPASAVIDSSVPSSGDTHANQGSVSTFMAALSETLLGLIQDMRVHPERDAVDTYAKAFQWKATPPEMNALLNAKKGYFGKFDGKVVLLGSDGTRDIISLAVRDGFDPAALVASLGKVVSLKRVGSDSSMGQQMDIYELTDSGKKLGLLSITYGSAESLRGTGTVGFISQSRVESEGIGK